MNSPISNFKELPISERIQLVEDIWDSIAEETSVSPQFSAANRVELQRRLAAHKADPLKVPHAQRYAAAWAEISTRILARQSISLYFSTITLSAITLFFGYVQNPQISGMIAIGLVLVTWAFVLWIRHNDATIGLLGAFCKSLEQADDPQNLSGIPAWHSDGQGWINHARNYRTYADMASIIVAILALIPVGSEIYNAYRSSGLSSITFFYAVFGMVGIVAGFFLYRNKFLRNEIATMAFLSGKDGKFSFIKTK